MFFFLTITLSLLSLISCQESDIHMHVNENEEATMGFPHLNVKKYTDCDKWSGKSGLDSNEKECIDNPNFMWSSCHGSCLENAKDNSDKCKEWAEQGECTQNPSYIQLHCPESCGKAVAWSHWARQKTGITSGLPLLGDDIEVYKCFNSYTSIDMMTAADIIKDRLQLYFHGGGEILKEALAYTAPSEYLGMLGLAEAYLYAFRLYKYSVDYHNQHLQSSEKEKVNSTAIDSYIHQVNHVIQLGYSPDLLMRLLPAWLVYLIESSIIASYANDNLVMEADPETTCPKARNGYPLKNIISFHDNVKTSSYKQIARNVKLSNNVLMPIVGLGTWQLNGAECEEAVVNAIKIGYRHFDSAEAYRNEGDVGWAIKNSIASGLVTREELFIATKLSDENNAGYLATKRLVEQQMKLLQVDYIDLYMLHSPISDKQKQDGSWKALEEFYDAGKIKALGCSNFNKQELSHLYDTARIKPMVVQNKADIYHIGKQLDNQGDDVVSYTKEKNILLVAYSSFSAYPFVMVPLKDPIVQGIALKNRITVSQVILKWQLQHGFAVIPRSSNEKNLKENFDVLTIADLSTEDMQILDSIQYLIESPVAIAVPI